MHKHGNNRPKAECMENRTKKHGRPSQTKQKQKAKAEIETGRCQQEEKQAGYIQQGFLNSHATCTGTVSLTAVGKTPQSSSIPSLSLTAANYDPQKSMLTLDLLVD